jgi:hypothetical protein
MISLNWILTVPPHLSAESFDNWYLHTHTLYGKASQDIVRYAVNRTLSNQPACATGTTYRVAQEYWADWDSFEKCWNSPSGHAVLGDGLANLGLGPEAIPAIAITEDTQFEVARPASFSTIRRGYRSSPDGTIVKFLAFGVAAGADGLKDWYRGRHGGIGSDPRVREHVFGTTLGRVLRIGLVGAIPGDGQTALDWVLELWFDTEAQATEFLSDTAFGTLWSELVERSTDVRSALYRGQEMLVATTALDHVDNTR